jgi:hypothetical protein
VFQGGSAGFSFNNNANSTTLASFSNAGIWTWSAYGAGIIHSTSGGVLSSSAIVDGDVTVNTLALNKLAQSAANTMLGNWTSSTANVTANSMPSCADSSGNHLNYVSGTGITCGTSISISAANPSASVGLSVVNGSASTYMRSDGAPALSQSIVPTWTGAHTWSATYVAFTNTAGAQSVNASIYQYSNYLILQAGSAGINFFQNGGGASFGNINNSTNVWTMTGATAATTKATGTLVLSTAGAGLGIGGAIYAGDEIVTGVVAVASLPACNAGRQGARHFVTDSNATSFTLGIGAVVAAGGTTAVPVVCDGTNWRIGAANDNIDQSFVQAA